MTTSCLFEAAERSRGPRGQHATIRTQDATIIDPVRAEINARPLGDEARFAAIRLESPGAAPRADR